MTPDEYQRAALRTEFTPDFVRLEGQTAEHNFMIARLIHATLGKVTEVAELADMLKKHLIYGKALDEVNVIEEVGDGSWYDALALDAIKKGFREAYTLNIAKLRKRFPDKFTQEAALNRDLDAERAALETTQAVDANGALVGKPTTNDTPFTLKIMELVDQWRAGDIGRGDFRGLVRDACRADLDAELAAEHRAMHGLDGDYPR